MTEPTPTKKSRKQEDLSIPDFLLVKNRPPDTGGEKTSASGRILEDWEIALSKLEPKELREYVKDAMRRGRFERTWLVPSHKRSQATVDETVAHWRGKMEAGQAMTAARAEKVKEKRKADRAEPPADLSPHLIIRFGGNNPKKEGTAAHKRWAFLESCDGSTVGVYLKAKGSNPTTLTNAVKSGHVTLEEGGDDKKTEAEQPKKSTKKTRKGKTK